MKFKVTGAGDQASSSTQAGHWTRALNGEISRERADWINFLPKLGSKQVVLIWPEQEEGE